MQLQAARPDLEADRDRALALVVPDEARAVQADGESFSALRMLQVLTEKIDGIPYRDVRLLQQFLAERGKIVPRRLIGFAPLTSAV